MEVLRLRKSCYDYDNVIPKKRVLGISGCSYDIDSNYFIETDSVIGPSIKEFFQTDIVVNYKRVMRFTDELGW